MNVTKRNSVSLKLMLTSPMIYLAFCFLIMYLKKFVASASSNVATEATVLTMEGLNYGNDAWIYSGYPSVLNVYSNGKIPTDSTLNGWEKSITGLKLILLHRSLLPRSPWVSLHRMCVRHGFLPSDFTRG